MYMKTDYDDKIDARIQIWCNSLPSKTAQVLTLFDLQKLKGYFQHTIKEVAAEEKKKHV